MQQETVIAAKSKEDSVRLSSSSGGIFFCLASYVLHNQGAVVGAAFTEDFKTVRHIVVENVNDLSLLQRSKYLESSFADVLPEVREKLEKGQMVLFTGTGCQVQYANNYLKELASSPLYYTLDVACHGTPMREIWGKYVAYLEKKQGHEISNVNFRDKEHGWKNYCVSLNFGEKKISEMFGKNVYMSWFLQNLSLKEACYHCKCKCTQGISDLSIGDLWGAQEIAPELDDDKGLSFVMIHSAKGLAIWERVEDVFKSKTVDLNQVVRFNPCIAKAVEKPLERDEFLKDIEKMDMEKVIRKYNDKGIAGLAFRAKRKVRRLRAKYHQT